MLNALTVLQKFPITFKIFHIATDEECKQEQAECGQPSLTGLSPEIEMSGAED